MSIDAALGKAIRHYRNLAGLRQEDVPGDQGNLSKVERGRQSLSVERLAEIAKVLHTTPSAIWAKAEESLRPARLPADTMAALAAAGERSEYQVRLAGLVEVIISTTPAVKPALIEFLRKSLELTREHQDRRVLTSLINRVESPKRPKSGVSRGRARVE